MIERDHDEVELKFRLRNLRPGERMLASASLGGLAASGPISVVRIEDRYVDTAGSALRAAGYVARLRANGDDVLVSVKSVARRGTGRVHRRREVEGQATQSLDPAAWPSSAARTLVLRLRGDAPLEHIVTLRQVRRQRIFSGDAASIELSIDEVQVVVNGLIVDRFIEAEAELISGDAGALTGIGNQLASMPGTSEATSSKLDTALAAIGRPASAVEPPPDAGGALEDVATVGSGSTRATTKRTRRSALSEPRSPGIRADDTVAEAGRKVLAFHLARMLARAPGARDGGMEELHQMRVATRRMRAAWRVFGDGFDARQTRRLRARLRRVAGLLGRVRDLDVLLEGAEAYQAGLSPTEQRGIDPLLARWRRDREVARRALIRELDGGPYRRWTESFLEFTITEGRSARLLAPTEPQRIRDTAPTRIWSAFARVRGYEPVLRWADVATLHELRITGKWLRYTLEFHADALGSDVSELIGRVTALQDHLGLLNDADVTADLLRTFLGEHATILGDGERSAIGRYLADREREVERLRRGVGTVWRGVAGLTFRRRLGRLMADL